jgi:hypothetical protein
MFVFSENNCENNLKCVSCTVVLRSTVPWVGEQNDVDLNLVLLPVELVVSRPKRQPHETIVCSIRPGFCEQEWRAVEQGVAAAGRLLVRFVF